MKQRLTCLCEISLVLFVIQIIRILLKQVFFIFFQKTMFSDRIASFIACILLSLTFIIISKRKNIKLSVFPKHFHLGYIIYSGFTALLLILTPILTKESSFKAIFILVYSSIVIPIFEELIFRGYVWNRLSIAFKKPFAVYIVSSVLFGLWHFGYIDSLSLHVQSGLGTVMLWKAITGLCFGLVLGIVRLKTKNTYSTILLHGILNTLGK